jgi:hypothetical protein
MTKASPSQFHARQIMVITQERSRMRSRLKRQTMKIFNASKRNKRMPKTKKAAQKLFRRRFLTALTSL